MAALRFAREIGAPLTAHLTVHWGGTMVGDDPDGKVFAHFRQLLDKRLQRRKLPDGLVAIWVREHHRQKRAEDASEVEHCHLLFHLPAKYRLGSHLLEILTVIGELVDLVANGNYDDRTIKLTFPRTPDAKYFLKGASRRTWDLYRIPRKWRSHRGEGLISAKRCGTTQNLGPAARRRWESKKQDQDK